MEYIYIVIPILSMLSAQFIKFIIESIKNKKLEFSRLLNGSGGMPSGHSAFVTSITTLIGITEGIDTPLFGLAFVFSVIVFYDATHVRYQAGLVTEYLNKSLNETRFKERLGHTKLEVVAGILLGICMTNLLYLIFK